MQNWRLIIFVMLLCTSQNWKVICRKKRVNIEETLLLPLIDTRPANCECGKLTRKIDDERLVKVKVAGGRVPWLVELVTTFDSYYNEPEEFRLCFGTLVSLQTAVFPASCIDTYARKKPQVKLLGVDNRKEAIRDVTSFLIHPNYRRKSDNDIAIVKLKQPIDFNQTKVVPICLPPARKKYSLTYLEREDSIDNRTLDMKVWLDNTGFADSEEEEPNRMRPCRNPNPPCQRRPCPPCPTTNRPATNKATLKPKPPEYQLKASVPRTWFYRKGPGYDYIQNYGRFDVDNFNSTKCRQLFPEMLQSKLTCVQHKEIRDIVKQNGNFFKQLELGMPLMLANTTLVKGKPQPATTKYYLEGMRAPGSSGGIPLLEARENAIALLKIEDYVPWIRENSFNGHFCRT